MQGLIHIVIEERIIPHLLLQMGAVKQIRMKKQGPAVQVHNFPVILLPSNLSRGDTYYSTAILIVIFAASILKIHAQMLVHKYSIHPVTVQAVAYR